MSSPRLGSVALPEPIGAHERVRFWRELRDRLRDIAVRLANRVSSGDRRKALAAMDGQTRQAIVMSPSEPYRPIIPN